MSVVPSLAIPDLRIAALPAPLGAVVEGIDAAEEARAEQVLALKAALHDHLVIIFKRQTLSDAALLRFATYFGSVFAPPHDAPVLGSDTAGVAPEIVLVANVEDGLLGNRELTAHSDHHWTPLPSSGSLLYALEVPASGGDTSFTNLALAYEELDAATQREIDGLRLITYNPFLRANSPLPGGNPLYRTPEIEPLTPFLSHPLVRTHPETGRRLLYLGAATEVEIVGYEPADGAALIARLRAHLAEPRLRYTHHWSPGDIVFWDNRITLHSRTAFDPAERRVMKRISLAGSRPF
jgi:alpha-ketoglutarate-dependent taurine dioxygenase